MEAYVINLKSSSDRWTTIQKSFKDILHLNRVDPVKPIQIKGLSKRYIAAQSLFLTVLKIIKYAKKNKLPNILILEDDCIPADNFLEKWSKIKLWLDMHLDEWDIYSGGSLQIIDPFMVGYTGSITFYRPKKTYASHFIYIHNRSYNTIINRYMKDLKENTKVTTDGTNLNLKLIISHPYVSYQIDGKSDILGEIRDDINDKMKEIERKLGKYKTRKLFYKPKKSNTRKKN